MRKTLAISVLLAVACILLGGWQQQGILVPIVGKSAAAGGGAAVTFVKTSTCSTTLTGGTTLVTTFGTANAAGNVIVVAIGFGPQTGTVSINTVSGSVNGAYTLDASTLKSLTATHYANINTEFAHKTSIGAGTESITVTFGSSLGSGAAYVCAYEITAGSLDQANGNTGTSATPSAGAVTTIHNGELVIAACNLDDGNGFGSGWFLAGSGFNLQTQSGGGNSDGATEYQAQANAGSVTGSFGTNFPGTSGPWAASIISFGN